jgi:hypothetical protein
LVRVVPVTVALSPRFLAVGVPQRDASGHDVTAFGRLYGVVDLRLAATVLGRLQRDPFVPGIFWVTPRSPPARSLWRAPIRGSLERQPARRWRPGPGSVPGSMTMSNPQHSAGPRPQSAGSLCSPRRNRERAACGRIPAGHACPEPHLPHGPGRGLLRSGQVAPDTPGTAPHARRCAGGCAAPARPRCRGRSSSVDAHGSVLSGFHLLY